LVQNHDHSDVLLLLGGHGSSVLTLSRSLPLKLLALQLGGSFSFSEFYLLESDLLLGLGLTSLDFAGSRSGLLSR
jgi:hypothetical protein